jgi:hypothetical protein
MKPVSCFSLENHSGQYETWPLRTRLLRDGMPTSTLLPGYSLLYQFEIADGYLFVTDWDCPFEESTNFILVNKAFRVLSSRSIGAPYSSWMLVHLRCIDQNRCEADFGDGDTWLITIRPWGIPYLLSRIRLDRIAKDGHVEPVGRNADEGDGRTLMRRIKRIYNSFRDKTCPGKTVDNE